MLLRLCEFGPCLGDVKHVDRPLPFRGNQNEIDTAAMLGDDTAEPVQQPKRVAGDDVENREAPRRLVVGVHHRRDARRPPPLHHALLAPAQQRGDLRSSGDDFLEHVQHLGVCVGIERQEPLVVLQKRGAYKEAFPGLLDASSAGHVAVRDGDRWRECEEELGIRPSDSDIVLPLGVRRTVTRLPNDRVDREHQELWLWLCRRALAELRPPAPEVAALVGVPVDAARRLVRGEVAALAADARLPGAAKRTHRLTIEVPDFIPGTAAYVAHICDLAARAVAGDRDLVFDSTAARFEG